MIGYEASDKQLTLLGRACGALAKMRDVSEAKVMRSVLASQTLRKHGYDHASQNGTLTADQAFAAVTLVNSWIYAATLMVREENEQIRNDRGLE